jgi:cytochrome c oxidase subunit 2
MLMKIIGVILLSLSLFAGGCSKPRSNKEPIRITVTAKKYAFQPNPIRVKEGDEVLLEVSSTDVQHGFHVPGLGIDESIQKGKPAQIRFSAKTKGDYNIECDVICGPGHDDMAGKIIVE